MKDKSITKEYILEMIYLIIDEHNELNPIDLKLEKSLETFTLWFRKQFRFIRFIKLFGRGRRHN